MSDEDEIILADLDDEELVQQMFDDLYDGLREEIEEGVNILISRDWAPYDVLTKALVGGMTIVGADFRDGILFVPEVLLAANAMKGGMAILKPLLAETGTRVAHCPLVFSRYGQMMESFGQYVKAGVSMAIGTDTQPHNMLEEMRLAATLGRIGGRHVEDTNIGEVFHAATIGGADALGRDDLGRIAIGAKADIVLVDLTHPAMRPVRDPLRSLVYSAADRAVKEVYVDGRQLVRDGTVLTVDRDAAADTLQKVQADMLQAVSKRDRL